MKEDEIDKILNNWHYKNYVTLDAIYVFNSSGGWDRCNVIEQKARWIIVDKKLIQANNAYQSIDFIKEECNRLLAENKDFLAIIKANEIIMNDYLIALINYQHNGKN